MWRRRPSRGAEGKVPKIPRQSQSASGNVAYCVVKDELNANAAQPT